MAMERNAAPRVSASSSAAASPSTVGALLSKASVAAAPARDIPSPRSLLSRILHRSGGGGGGGGGGGFGCRLRLPRYCSSGAAAKEDAAAEYAAANVEAAAPKVVARESPRSSLGKKAAEEVSPASLGLGASLVLLLSKSAAELNRMAELRAQMERLVLDVKGEEARSSNHPNASDDHADITKEEPTAFSGGALSRCSRTAAAPGNAGHRAAVPMDQMEAELEAELTLLQFAASNNHQCATPRRDRQLETELKSGDEEEESTDTHAATFADADDDTDGADDDEEEEEESGPAAQGGVSARELERRLHELLQSRHEERIAELETALERARKRLQEKEREVCWWRNTAKLVTRHKDDSRLR
uniref:Protein POLAR LOCALIZATION DURING ASYMMETRIC DIVISION AND REDISTRIBUTION n=1 Tax=Oryza meridionalis TaxID=40149 RepID=A0A0E0CSH8_9ORYZ